MVSSKLQYFNIYRFFFNLLALLILGFFLVSCNKKETQQILTAGQDETVTRSGVDINTASVEELEKLPDIGAGLAQRIIEYREKYGRFRKPEHLILVQGISDKRFRQLQNLIKTE